MRTWTLGMALTGLLATGCLPAPGTGPTPAPQDGARWVEGPTSQVRTLLVPAERMSRLEAPGSPRVEVSMGAFFARFETRSGPLDQLALLVVLEGSDPVTVVELGDRLLLEMDGARFVGEPGGTANSYRLEAVPAGVRLTMAVPVGLPELERLIDAGEVRGQLGSWGVFSFPREDRIRLRSLVEQLPPGAPLLAPLGTGARLAQVTE